jgi:hypothetical protein
LSTLEWECFANYRKEFPYNDNLSSDLNFITTNRADAMKQNDFVNRSLNSTSCKLELKLHGKQENSITVTVSLEAKKALIVLGCVTIFTLYASTALAPALPNISTLLPNASITSTAKLLGEGKNRRHNPQLIRKMLTVPLLYFQSSSLDI